jgi:flagellin
MRSNMGAFVNRIEHAINNLTISNTNQQAAESLIRDVDFAHETARFTRNQILTQSATAMLSQANMVPQSVLQLLG